MPRRRPASPWSGGIGSGTSGCTARWSTDTRARARSTGIMGYAHPPVVDRHRAPVRAAPRARRDRGPAFCRSGRGHPVHGWAWCVRKGFVRPRPYRELPPRAAPGRRPIACCTWHPVELGPVYFRGDPYRRMDRSLGHSALLSLLGRGVIDDLYARVEYRREVPPRGPVASVHGGGPRAPGSGRIHSRGGAHGPGSGPEGGSGAPGPGRIGGSMSDRRAGPCPELRPPLPRVTDSASNPL